MDGVCRVPVLSGQNGMIISEIVCIDCVPGQNGTIISEIVCINCMQLQWQFWMQEIV